MKAVSLRLRTQIALLVLGVLIVAQALSLWLFVDERSLAVQAAIGAEAAGRAANVAQLIEGAPSDLHAQIISAATSPLVRFDLSDQPKVTHEHFNQGIAVEARVRALLGDSYSRDIRVEVHETEQGLLPLPNLSPEMAEMHAEMMQGRLAAIEMELSIALAGGQWLNVGTRFERPPLQWSLASNVSFAITAALLLVVSFWFLLTRLTGPLNTLAEASDRLGRGARKGPLPVVGPKEVQDLTRAFNTMQDRLTRFVSDRTQMLAALAHDLRSPLTALRVRAEMVEDGETRESLIASSEEMQQMVEATLDFAKGVGQHEEVLPTNLNDLMAGFEAPELSLLSDKDLVVPVKPGAMRRALRNLTENAMRYGKEARVSWQAVGSDADIFVDDDGPGIPDSELETVFSPYVRLETSRSRNTGGHGLGLSIARSIILEHGGSIELLNRPEGGLRARIRLPLELHTQTVATESLVEPKSDGQDIDVRISLKT
ncbi:signal transduction histidine kinase [Litoreibacter halocynthiae]|uniref:histidine kinase n=1 Tax=Litoreibacter halocynthiae TaxID=1242689 RepID=A0A4R7LB61_9RHOB|nr:ATP-binding protein [Litoreibacter halocynthiae]TDT72703.1 signal transduction histidine kinase [Litoreibacter halocynthiae]